MSSTNWIIAIVVVVLLGVGAYFVFDNGSDDGAAMHPQGALMTNPNATGTDMMTNDGSGNSMHDGDMMQASGTVHVSTY
jgi:hypothetical protein